MRPLLQHASRSLTAKCTSAAPLLRPLGGFTRAKPTICLTCQYRAAFTPPQHNDGAQLSLKIPGEWLRRSFSSSARWSEEKKAPNSTEPMSMPPPASEQDAVPRHQSEDKARQIGNSVEDRLESQDQLNTLLHRKNDAQDGRHGTESVPEPTTLNAQEELPQKPTARKSDDVADNITRVPDEHLPSHRERQRWDLSRRFSEAMDDLLPKLATVTQKVNSYTGTDYSGVEALRREIKEQENLVKARRAAIDTSKHALDTAHAQQASAQKEVVALLERKHSWSAGDLERYMSLIRSEHINDQAIRLAKESVVNAEAALEEARTQLEKRERAQYHEEQIWSDTIRRNSTWVTFGLMGVNIFLLLLSLAILEPWRRRRMVREIKSALAANKAATEAAPTSAATVMASSPLEQDIAVIEEEIDRVTDSDNTYVESASPAAAETVVEESPIAEMKAELPVDTDAEMLQSVSDTIPDIAAPVTTPLMSDNRESLVAEDLSPPDFLHEKPAGWQGKMSAIAQDIISERLISMRRIDYTTAILQGAAAGAVITASLIAMLRTT